MTGPAVSLKFELHEACFATADERVVWWQQAAMSCTGTPGSQARLLALHTSLDPLTRPRCCFCSDPSAAVVSAPTPVPTPHSCPPLPHQPTRREGDLVTVSHRNDIQRAMQESVEAASRGAGARVQLTQQALPPIRLQVVKVASEVRRVKGRGGLRRVTWVHQPGAGVWDVVQ